MTLCPKCGAILLVTTAGEICQNCGWRSVGSTGWVSDNTVNLPLIISDKSLKIHSLETVINDLTTRVGTLETDLERLKEIIKEKSQEKSTKDNLKSCPFCGRDVRVVTAIEGIGDAPDYYTIAHPDDTDCIIDGMETSAYPNKEELIEDWNRRVKE